MRRIGMLRVGIAMLQGARHEHAEAIRSAASQLETDVEIVALRVPSDLEYGIDALILPGGESTTMRIASKHFALLEALFSYIDSHPQLPILGTCAGAILLATPPEPFRRFIDVNITRNSWGRQRESFEAVVDLTLPGATSMSSPSAYPQRDGSHLPLMMEMQAAPIVSEGFPGVFIRAPRFGKVGQSCNVIATFNNEAVGIQQGNILALTFHPELTKDRRFHAWLLSKANGMVNE
jgi:5'-phosphate synthase pdxT subunit